MFRPITDAELSRQEWFEERAGILEFDAGFERAEAERKAVEMWEEYATSCPY